MPDDDEFSAWEGLGESWMTPTSEAALFKRDAEAEARRAKLAQAVLERGREIAAGRRAAEVLWRAICESLRNSRSGR